MISLKSKFLYFVDKLFTLLGVGNLRINIFQPVVMSNFQEDRGFPKKLSKFKYVKRFGIKKHFGQYNFALYKDKSNKKYFVKKWSGEERNLTLHWLENEISVYQVINGKSDIGRFCTPRIFHVEKTLNSLYLVLEFKKGEDLSTLSDSQRIDFYWDAILYLQNLYDRVSSSVTGRIPSRSPMFWLLILPILTCRAIYYHPSLLLLILRKSIKTILFSPLIILRRNRTLVHRDFNQYNLLVDKKSICLLDFQLVCVADPMVELAILIMKFYDRNEMIFRLHKKIFSDPLLNGWVSITTLNLYLNIVSIYDLSLTDGSHNLSTRSLTNGLNFKFDERKYI